MIHFPRTALAEQLVNALQGKDPFGDAQNGLFLTAPRRTGKSTFLQTDQMNSPGKVRLMLIMSGSDRDKLLRLVHTAAAPFYGSQIKPMPVLGYDFIEFVAEAIEKHHAALGPVNRATLLEAFQHFGARPQFFLEALGQVLSPFSGTSQRPEEAILTAARDRESLRTRQPPVAWKSAHGEYAVEDVAMHRWFEQRSAAKLWPPVLDPPVTASIEYSEILFDAMLAT